MQFADPKNDLAFKKIFGNEEHKEILISFLNSVLDFKDKKEIVDVNLANPYQVPKIQELKETILDIRAKNRNGDSFIVEMQKKDLGDFAKRSLYYTSKAYISSLSKGEDYSKLRKVYFIGIVNFEMFENKNYISRHLIINQETQNQDLDDFEFYFLELPKFNKELNELESILDKWIYFIKNANSLEMIPKEFKFKPFDDAFNIAMQTTWDKKELEIYDYVSLKEMDDRNALRTAEKKGFQRGIEKGIEKEKREIVKNSLNLNLDKDTISKLTGLAIRILTICFR
jgi:predicted transposase/invertase (TIGR01784 family)